MAYVLYKEHTQRFINYTDTGRIEHVGNIEKAYKFKTLEQTKEAKKQASKKTKFFDVYAITEDGILEKVSFKKTKRKQISKDLRNQVYDKTDGRCYLCGEFLDFDYFEVEHRIPLTKGGSNEFDNLFPSCHCCNTMKSSIYPQELIEKIIQIFMYQMEQKTNNSLKWKIVHRLLLSCIK